MFNGHKGKMKMGSENKNCRDCKYFSRYYTKEEKRFERTKCGWCCKAGKTVNSGEGCEKFERRGKRKEEWLLRQYLSDILTELTELRKIIEAEHEEL